jgi:hypothetical protein
MVRRDLKKERLMIAAEMAIFLPRQKLGTRRFKRPPSVGDRVEWQGKRWQVNGVVSCYPGPTNVTVFVGEI